MLNDARTLLLTCKRIISDPYETLDMYQWHYDRADPSREEIPAEGLGSDLSYLGCVQRGYIQAFVVAEHLSKARSDDTLVPNI